MGRGDVVTPAENFEVLLRHLMGVTSCVDLKERLRDPVNCRTASADAVAWLVDTIGTGPVVRALASTIGYDDLVVVMVEQGVLEQGTVLSCTSGVADHIDGEVVRFRGRGPFYRLPDPPKGWATEPGGTDRG
jgi:hypothetical protein